MKIFVVVTERDGEVTKVPGRVEIGIVRTDTRYAARSMEEVWEATRHLRYEESEETMIGIFEEHPSITVLGEPDA